jgi:hypothetical protein
MAIPGPPIMDAATARQVRDVMARGFAGTLFLTTDDVHAAYKQLKESHRSNSAGHRPQGHRRTLAR